MATMVKTLARSISLAWAASLLLPLAALPSVASFAVPSTMASPAAAAGSVGLSLGPAALRDLVLDAASSDQSRSLDLDGVAWLEHLNLVVGDMDAAAKFYVDFLGMTPERPANPKSNHFNLGRQQFHLAAATDDDPVQRVTGSIGLVVPSLERVRGRAGDAQSALEGTEFSIVDDCEDRNVMTVTCPWGNVIHLYDISVDDDCRSESPSPQKMVAFHEPGGAYGPHRMAVRGGPGIRYVEVACRAGTADVIAEFYEETLGCHVTRSTVDRSTSSSCGVATVCVGPGVHLAFVESDDLSDGVVKQMEGVHACIYIPHFERTYHALKERGMIWTNPRFTHLDSCDTWEEARASRTFRFKDIVSARTGDKVLELEHETRPMLHGQYMKVPPYQPN